MANFDSAVALVLKNEGGFSDNPADSGGATNFGISLRFLREIPSTDLKKYGFFEPLTVESIRMMTLDQAKAIYQGEFWEAAPFESIKQLTAANYLFDCCVNHGLAQGIKLLQWALWAASGSMTLKDDGVLGASTLALLNSSAFVILPTLRATRAGFMRQIGIGKDKEFLDGWLRRAYS